MGGGGLWEFRSNFVGGRAARVLFCVEEGELVSLRVLIKKTQKTPDAELDLAKNG